MYIVQESPYLLGPRGAGLRLRKDVSRRRRERKTMDLVFFLLSILPPDPLRIEPVAAEGTLKGVCRMQTSAIETPERVGTILTLRGRKNGLGLVVRVALAAGSK